MNTLLKERVKEMGIKQSQIADKLDISKTYTSRILSNKRPLSYKLACKLADELNYKSPISVILAKNNVNVDDDLDNKLSKADEIIEEMVCNFFISKFEEDISREEKNSFVGKISALVLIYESAEDKQKFEELI